MGRARWEERRARHVLGMRKGGIKVADLRTFLDLVDSSEVAEDAWVHINTRMGEGGVTSGYIEASSRHPLPLDDEAATS